MKLKDIMGFDEYQGLIREIKLKVDTKPMLEIKWLKLALNKFDMQLKYFDDQDLKDIVKKQKKLCIEALNKRIEWTKLDFAEFTKDIYVSDVEIKNIYDTLKPGKHNKNKKLTIGDITEEMFITGNLNNWK